MRTHLQDMIDGAFNAILAGEWDSANKYLAAAQRDRFGLKPWRPGVPAYDVMGYSIVFEDLGTGRYSVSDVQPDGAHIRIVLPARRQLISPLTFESHAPTVDAARELGTRYAKREGVWLKMVENTVSARSDGWAVVNYTKRSSWD